MNVISKTSPIELLVVEDDPGDVVMTREALSEAKVLHNLHVIDNGENAIDFLRRSGQYNEVPRPDLIFLDLNLPRLTGRDVLATIKADASLRQIPVVVLTTSDSEEDVVRCYDLHANAFVTKPVDFAAFTQAIRQIDNFFITVARLPGR